MIVGVGEDVTAVHRDVPGVLWALEPPSHAREPCHGAPENLVDAPKPVATSRQPYLLPAVSHVTSERNIFGQEAILSTQAQTSPPAGIPGRPVLSVPKRTALGWCSYLRHLGKKLVHQQRRHSTTQPACIAARPRDGLQDACGPSDASAYTPGPCELRATTSSSAW